MLLTVTGRRTAKRYTTPVQYKRDGELSESDARALLPQVVVIRIDLD